MTVTCIPFHGSAQRTTVEKLNEYLMVAEAAEVLGVSQTTVRKYASKGKLPVHTHPGNGYRLFRRSDLENFLQRASRESSANHGDRDQI